MILLQVLLQNSLLMLLSVTPVELLSLSFPTANLRQQHQFPDETDWILSIVRYPFPYSLWTFSSLGAWMRIVHCASAGLLPLNRMLSSLSVQSFDWMKVPTALGVPRNLRKFRLRRIDANCFSSCSLFNGVTTTFSGSKGFWMRAERSVLSFVDRCNRPRQPCYALSLL